MTETSSSGEIRTGFTAAIIAYLWWGGVMPAFLIATRSIDADQVLVHRIIWSVPFGALIIIGREQWPEVLRAIRTPKVLLALVASSLVMAVNWLIYIQSVQNQNLFEAALGYYINPLVYVLVGVVFLSEKLTRAQIAAVVLAGIGVSVLTVGGGRVPFVALTLAVSFTAYGYIRKMTPVGAMPGLFIETLIMSPAALIWLLFLAQPTGAVFGDSASINALLIAAGPITVVPLLAFAIGARRLPLSTIGFLQFIGPSLQFVAGLLDGEPFTVPHQICFTFIWLAAMVFAGDAIRRSRATRQPA